MNCRTWKDRFRVLDTRGARWRLHGERADVLLTRVDLAAGSSTSSADQGFEAIECEWSGDRVNFKLSGPGATHAGTARSVFVHEPRPELYAILSLPVFAAPQRRFWWRVFRLVRLPGGRWLLGVLARRARA
jgi:hypothetical protein